MQVIAATLVHEPRPLQRTLDAAKAFGINLVTEADCLWLADLALSLPPPAGWVLVERPVSQGTAFWYNELTGSAQYQHPVDHFIKNTLKLLRTGHAHSKPANSFRRLSLMGSSS